MSSLSITTTHIFIQDHLSIIAYSLGKDDLDPAHVTQEEVGRFMMDAILDRIELYRPTWEAYAKDR